MTSTLLRTKRCTKCDTVKPVDDFRWRTQRGIAAPRSSCRACEAEYDRVRQADEAVRVKRQTRQREQWRAKYGVSSEIDHLVRPAARHDETPKPPLPTAAQLADWHRRGCPL